MEISFKLSFWLCLINVGINADARSHDEPHNPNSGAGYLEAQLILKLFTTMENDIKELRDELEDLKAKTRDQPKAVLAQVQFLEERQLSVGERVKFTGTVANVGEAYNAGEGYFVAPYDGTYLFTVSLCMPGGNYVEFHIVQDGTILGQGFSGDTKWFTCPSSTAVTYMKTGSKVWVQIDRVHGGSVNKAHGISSFTAVFLNNFQKPLIA